MIKGQFNQNFRIQNYLLQKGSSEEIVGFFVKGNKQQIKELCNTHNGNYHSSVKGWHSSIILVTSQYYLSIISVVP